MTIPRVAVICDLIEEKWHSMDLVAEMLLQNLRAHHSSVVQATRICPPLKRRFDLLPAPGKRSRRFNADRAINRFYDYPRYLKKHRQEFDLFHLVDHSYAQLLHQLPAQRTIVTCHDLDTFRSVLEPESHPRSRAFVAMTRRILDGLGKAARVTCDSNATRDELLRFQIVPTERTVVIPNGVHPSCSPFPDATADEEAARLLGPISAEAPELLHVSSTIPRKRIDVLLQVFAEVRKAVPEVRLVRVGGPFTEQQARTVEQLNLTDAIVDLPAVSRPVLAAVYRRAALVLLPSEREGFGLPVVEAMACGTTVVASDLDVLHEVGGTAAAYCSVGDISGWTDAIVNLLHEQRVDPAAWADRKETALAQAAKFTWEEYAARTVAVYQDVWEAG